MRNISRVIATAFRDRRTKSISNSRTDEFGYYLHGHKIANWDKDHNGKILSFSLCGWGTVTTRERLNSLFRVLSYPISIQQKNYNQVLNFKDKSLVIDSDTAINYHVDLDCITFGSGDISLSKYEAIQEGWLDK